MKILFICILMLSLSLRYFDVLIMQNQDELENHTIILGACQTIFFFFTNLRWLDLMCRGHMKTWDTCRTSPQQTLPLICAGNAPLSQRSGDGKGAMTWHINRGDQGTLPLFHPYFRMAIVLIRLAVEHLLIYCSDVLLVSLLAVPLLWM